MTAGRRATAAAELWAARSCGCGALVERKQTRCVKCRNRSRWTRRRVSRVRVG